MTSVLYTVGSGSAVATDGAWLLADAPPTAEFIRDLWTRLTGDLDRAALLAALSEGGASRVPSFALVLTGEPAVVLVSGEARVLLDGPEGQALVDSRTSSAWTEAALPHGTAGATLLLTNADADAQIPALAGVFPASALVVRWTPSAVVPRRPTTAPPVVPPSPTAPPPTSAVFEEPTEVLPTPASDADSFFDQEALPDLPDTTAVRPRPAGPPPSAPDPARNGMLLISNGVQIVLDRGAVLGRSPEWHGRDQRHLVTVAGGFGDVSRSHVGVTLDGEQVQVEDLGSTNGTLVAQPGAPEHLLQVGVAETMQPGAVVTLSRDVSFTYEIDLR